MLVCAVLRVCEEYVVYFWSTVSLVSIWYSAWGRGILAVSDKGVILCNTTLGTQRNLVQGNVLKIKEVDYHYPRNELYGLTKSQIIRGSLLATDTFKYELVVYSERERNLMSMTVDWVHDRLYWTAGPVFTIHEATLNGSKHSVVYQEQTSGNFHRKLLVDPFVRLLVWASANQIFKLSLNDKTHREIKFPTILGSVKIIVRDIAVDVTAQRVYHLAGFEDDSVWKLTSGNYDGCEFRIHYSVPRFTYGLAVMGKELYWFSKNFARTKETPGELTQNHTMELLRAYIDIPGSRQKVLDNLNAGTVWSMKVFDPGFQEVPSRL